jgi:mannitol/fructose-specific phosphotransferase system IIA component (Ntr-type)
MRMSDFVVRDAIVPALTATTKEGVIREIVESLRAAGPFKNADVDDVVRAILKREMLGSTGIGRAVAIPHTKHVCVERLLGTVAVSKIGVPFDSLDGEPVFVFFLLISPQDRPGDHLRALENVSRRLRDDGFVHGLRNAETRDAIWALLESDDSQRPG